MPAWNYIDIQLDKPALLKRIVVDATTGHGYLVTFSNVDERKRPVAPAFWAGTAPHLIRYPNTRTARRHAVMLAPDVIWTLPEEAVCRFLRLYHQDGVVRGFRPHLLNPIEAS